MPVSVQSQALRDGLASRNNVDIWRVDLNPEQQFSGTQENLGLLSPQEQIRADRFLRQEPRTNYINRRCVLRHLLAKYLQQCPADIAIETTGFGKPYLACLADAWLCFNIAHSNTQMLVAVARDRRVGVDIERVDERLEHSEIVWNYFAPEEQAEIAQLPPPDQVTAFFECWTRKEAYLKATGCGLFTPLDSFIVSARPNMPATFYKKTEHPAAASWTLCDVPVAPGYAAAVVAEGDVLVLRYLDYVWTANRTRNAKLNC